MIWHEITQQLKTPVMRGFLFLSFIFASLHLKTTFNAVAREKPASMDWEVVTKTLGQVKLEHT